MLHLNIMKPIQWLVCNSNFLGQTGYDWSAQSMVKKIDVLETTCIEIQKDGSKFFDEDFMNDIFYRISKDVNGNLGPLQPLADAMKFTFEEKQTDAVDGSKVFPYNLLNCELFYP